MPKKWYKELILANRKIGMVFERKGKMPEIEFLIHDNLLQNLEDYFQEKWGVELSDGIATCIHDMRILKAGLIPQAAAVFPWKLKKMRRFNPLHGKYGTGQLINANVAVPTYIYNGLEDLFKKYFPHFDIEDKRLRNSTFLYRLMYHLGVPKK